MKIVSYVPCCKCGSKATYLVRVNHCESEWDDVTIGVDILYHRCHEGGYDFKTISHGPESRRKLVEMGFYSRPLKKCGFPHLANAYFDK